MRKIGKCVHYNGTVNECCEAGVNYEELAGPGSGAWARRLPCFSLEYRGFSGQAFPRDEVVPVCPRRQEPTAEEVESDRKAVSETFEKTVKARDAIVAKIGPYKKGQSNSVLGRIDCPVCGLAEGLGYSRSGYNGHIHAKCEGKDCVAWIE